MTWDEQLFALFDDLEQQADDLFRTEREAEIAERARAEYSAVSLASRLMASVGQPVVLQVRSVGAVAGALQRVSSQWCLVAGQGQEWIVPLAAVGQVQGASRRSLAESAWSPVARLGLGSALRRLADTRERCLVHLYDGTRCDLRPERVGADFLEGVTGQATSVLVAFTAIAAVQKRD
ncbi:hypothetical protein [Nocardioides sp.]|uniref:hypothetical protein n=1 Tax=Nocardioides sp. TaxID=35761 RepID=UPI003D10A312